MTPNVTELAGFFRIFSNPVASSALPQASTALDTSASSFALTASPTDLLNGTLGGLTLAAAALGSPALARVCSHPLFAGAALYLGASHQIHAWGQVNGVLSGALLFFSGVSTLINGFSFYKGIKAGWHALKGATRLAVFDRVQQLQKQVAADLEKAIERTDHPVLRAAKSDVEVSQADIKTAVGHFKYTRDNMAERVEGALQSSLRAADPQKAAAFPHESVRQRGSEAQAAAMEAAWTASRTARLVPATLARFRENLDDDTVGLVKRALEGSNEVEKLLETATMGGSVWQRWKALRSSKKHQRYLRRVTVQAAEAERVSSASPRNWVTQARSDSSYSPRQKAIGHWLGKNVNAGLLYTVPVLATVQALAGGYDYAAGQLSGGGFFSQIVTSVLSLVPAAVTYLYNKRQGSRRFNVSPASNQELPYESAGENKLQKKTLKRLKSAVPSLAPGEREADIDKAHGKATAMRADLKRLTTVNVPAPTKSVDVSPVLRDESWKNNRSRNFTPIANPDPQRSYRYDHRRGQPDTEERKRIRMAIKAMPLEQQEDAIRRGEVTHEDLFNMVRDHPVAKDGAVITRPIEGRLESEILKLAREADRKGIIRHFVMAKDLFTGIDGVVTGGSETTYLTDFGVSPLVERMVEQGFIPIPCGLTAGANGPDGLMNAYGAVGNPKIAKHDTGGSSSGEAYALGLADFIVRLAIGTDTGGSITSPCGSVKLFGWVPEKGMLARANMIPYATHLDTPGLMGVDRSEVLWMARLLTIPAYQSRFETVKKMPPVYFFKTDLPLVSKGSQRNFEKYVERLRADGIEVIELGEKFKPYRTIPPDLYRASYGYAAMAGMNPLQENPWGEAPRFIKDPRLKFRMARAEAMFDEKDADHGNLFNNYRDIETLFRDLFDRKFPADAVFITPAPEAVALSDFGPNGSAEDLLDNHDILAGMLKNRTDRGAFVDPELGVVFEGRTGDMLAVVLGQSVVQQAQPTNGVHASSPNDQVALENIEAELQDLYPMISEAGFDQAFPVLAKKVFEFWKADGCPPQMAPYFERAETMLYEVLQKNGNLQLLAKLPARERMSGAGSITKQSVPTNGHANGRAKASNGGNGHFPGGIPIPLHERPVTVESIEVKLQERFPSFTNGHQPVGRVLAKMAFKAWEADGHPHRAEDVPGRYVQVAVERLYEELQRQGDLELLDKFRSQDKENFPPHTS